MLTGISDIDVNIISFCNLDTIENLLFTKRLIIKAVPVIVKYNDCVNLAYFISNLINRKEIDFAKKFIEECEKQKKDSDEYYGTILQDYDQGIIEVYFLINCCVDKIIGYFRDYLNLHYRYYLIETCLIDIINFYNAAINTKNKKVFKFLLDYCDNEDFITCCEDDSGELLKEINELNIMTREIIKQC